MNLGVGVILTISINGNPAKTLVGCLNLILNVLATTCTAGPSNESCLVISFARVFYTIVSVVKDVKVRRDSNDFARVKACTIGACASAKSAAGSCSSGVAIALVLLLLLPPIEVGFGLGYFFRSRIESTTISTLLVEICLTFVGYPSDGEGRLPILAVTIGWAA